MVGFHNVDEELVTYTFAWHSHHDTKTCHKCMALDGKEWTDQDLYRQEVLWDTIWGDLWNFRSDHSLAHGGGPYHCRCQLEVRVNVDMTRWDEYLEFVKNVNLAEDGGAVSASNIDEVTSKVDSLFSRLSEASSQLEEVNSLFTTYLALSRRFGLPDNIMNALVKLQQVRISIITAYRALQFLQTAYLTAGPLGWLMFFGTTAVSGFMMADLYYEVANK